MKPVQTIFITIIYLILYFGISYVIELYTGFQDEFMPIFFIGIFFAGILAVLLSLEVPEKISDMILERKYKEKTSEEEPEEIELSEDFFERTQEEGGENNEKEQTIVQPIN